MAGLHADNGGAGISNAADEFAMMGISSKGDPSTDNDIGIVDSGCSRSMTGNKEKLDDFVQIKGGISCNTLTCSLYHKSVIKRTKLEPTSIAKALEDPDWVDAMQEEMQQFINQQVWKLVPLPAGKHAIGTKWILKNKRDARGIVVRNKA
ncbi:putative ribonuclease H-like domain-containing protein, partial [Tanacetum coccineum]